MTDHYSYPGLRGESSTLISGVSQQQRFLVRFRGGYTFLIRNFSWMHIIHLVKVGRQHMCSMEDSPLSPG
jgi:hypothetical protein